MHSDTIKLIKSFVNSFPSNNLIESISDALSVIFESEDDKKKFNKKVFDELKTQYTNQLDGGLGDKTIPSDVDQDQLFNGIKVEFEHTHDPMLAMEIALDHLTEIPEYYTWLDEMEQNAKDSEIDAIHESIEETKKMRYIPPTKPDYKVKLLEWLNKNKSKLSDEELQKFRLAINTFNNAGAIIDATVYDMFKEYNISYPGPKYEYIDDESNSEPNTDAEFNSKYNKSLDTIQGVQSSHRGMIPKFRGVTMDKIKQHLKHSRSYGGDLYMGKELAKFDSIEDLRNHIYYHGTGTNISSLKVGGTLPKNAFRSGGYEDMQHTISVSKSKEKASAFTGDRSSGNVYPVLLKKGSRVIDMEGTVKDAMDLEEFLPKLWNADVDAVWIGGGEEELAVLNPKAIVLGKGESFKVFNKNKFINDDVEEFANQYGITFDKSLNESIDDQIESTQCYMVTDGTVYDDENEELPNSYELLISAERLVTECGMNMLRDDNIFIICVNNNSVVGVLYYSFDNNELRWSIAVSPSMRNHGIAKQLFNMVNSIPEYDYSNTVISELISPYYLEKLVSSNGYEKIAEDHGFRIYAKKLNNDSEDSESIELLEGQGWYPEFKYPIKELSFREKLIFSIISMYKAMNENNKKKLASKMKGMSKWELEKYPDDFLLSLKMDANDIRDAEKDVLASQKAELNRPKIEKKMNKAYANQRDQQAKENVEYDEYKKLIEELEII